MIVSYGWYFYPVVYRKLTSAERTGGRNKFVLCRVYEQGSGKSYVNKACSEYYKNITNVLVATHVDLYVFLLV